MGQPPLQGAVKQSNKGTFSMARRISGAFGGRIRLSYSGGADFFNIDK